MKILAIETSHDDTSLSLYKDKNVLIEKTISQTDFHKKFGGTIPEFAARKHSENILKALEYIISHEKIDDIDFVAYTNNPGLIGSLHVGRIFAKTIATSFNKKAIPINHMHGHIFSCEYTNEIEFPSLALIVSGGHTQIWHLNSYNPKDIFLIGETKDDAVGEVYDKIARKLNLGFPGGPAIDKLSQENIPIKNIFKLKDDGTYDFSFSGLKTKVINYILKSDLNNNETVKMISKEFQTSIIDILLSKFERAILNYKPKSIILGGGVSANSELRLRFMKLHKKALIPEMKYTTDNASMIAIAADLQKKFFKF